MTEYSVSASSSGPIAVGDRATAIQHVGVYYNIYEAAAIAAPITPQLKPQLARLFDRHALFGGRDSQLKIVDAFVAQLAAPYLFVTGLSGFGKTALLAHWVQRAAPGARDVCYQFISPLDRAADEDFTFRNLCQQLAHFHGLQGTLPPTAAEIRALYTQLLLIPPPAGKSVVIVMDGLDESLSSNWSPGPELFPRSLPTGVHVIFSARKIADTDWLANLEIPPGAVQVLELNTLGLAEIAGVVAAAGNGAVQWALEQPFLKVLLKVSQGDPFFVRYLVEDVRDVPIKTVSELRRRPRGLKAYLDRWWTDVSKQVPEEAVRDLLGYLLVAKGPVPRTDLIAISDDDKLDSFTFDNTIEQMRRYVLGDEAGGFTLCHPRFQDYVARERISPNDQRPYRARLLEFCLRWPEHGSEYALRYVAAHLADAVRASGQPERHAYAQQLVRLVASSEFQRVHRKKCDDFLGLQSDLDRAVVSAAENDHPNAVLPLVEGALARVALGQELSPKQLFDAAVAGDPRESERHLSAFSVSLDWHRAVVLIVAWLAVDHNIQAARELCHEVAGGLDTGPGGAIDEVFQRLLEWLRATLDGLPPPAADLPEPPSWMPPEEVAAAIIARLGGQDGEMLPSGGMELLGRGLSEQLVGSGFLAEVDGPMLVALAANDPSGRSDQYLHRYLELHATNPYPQYRNGSLWQLLRAVLKHPQPAWARHMARTIAEAALSGYRIDFRDGLALALVGSRVRLGDPAAATLLEREREAAVGALASSWPNAQSDPWAAHKRRAAMLAEVFSSLGALSLADQLLTRLPGNVLSFAGFQAPACVTVAEAMRVCQPENTVRMNDALAAAESAAHNVQSPVFCARTVAQLNTLRLRPWASPHHRDGIANAVERLARDPRSAEFASMHIVGEQFSLREKGPTKVELPPTFRSARSTADIADMYECSLSDLLELNGNRFSSTEQQLQPGVHVSIPDAETAPLVAAFLSAEVCADAALSPQQRTRLLALLVPVALGNPTALDTILARLLLAAQPADVKLLYSLEELFTRYPIGGRPEAGGRVHLRIDYAVARIEKLTV